MIRLKLREVLTQKEISQMKLSRLSEVSLTTIQRMCSNPYYNASLDVLDRLAHALEVKVSDLYEQEPDQKNRSAIDVIKSPGSLDPCSSLTR